MLDVAYVLDASVCETGEDILLKVTKGKFCFRSSTPKFILSA